MQWPESQLSNQGAKWLLLKPALSKLVGLIRFRPVVKASVCRFVRIIIELYSNYSKPALPCQSERTLLLENPNGSLLQLVNLSGAERRRANQSGIEKKIEPIRQVLYAGLIDPAIWHFVRMCLDSDIVNWWLAGSKKVPNLGCFLNLRKEWEDRRQKLPAFNTSFVFNLGVSCSK